MNIKKLFVTMLACAMVAGCGDSSSGFHNGKDVTQDFLSQYNGEYLENTELGGTAEAMIIKRNGEIHLMKSRQVGSENDPSIPYPTVCSYALKGIINHVIELKEEYRQRTNKETKEKFLTPETHTMTFTVTDIELSDKLEPSTTSTSGCKNFEIEMKAKLPSYTYGLELFGNGILRLHTSGGGDYVGGERTESTLDEVFERKK